MSAPARNTQGVLPGSVVTSKNHTIRIAHVGSCRQIPTPPRSPEGNLLNQPSQREIRP